MSADPADFPGALDLQAVRLALPGPGFLAITSGTIATKADIQMTCPDQWDLSPREAIVLQRELASNIQIKPLPQSFQLLGASDVAYAKASNQLVAAMVTFKWPSLEHLETAFVVSTVRFPYVPGLLSFREVPALLTAYGKLHQKPEVLLCDGQGIAHPRRLGLASHLGLCLGIPAVGCAKSKLCGDFEPFELIRGNYRSLRLQGEAVGYVFCSRNGVKPIFISPGHLADLESSRRLVERSLGRYRIPEPLRKAHHTATQLRKKLTSIQIAEAMPIKQGR